MEQSIMNCLSNFFPSSPIDKTERNLLFEAIATQKSEQIKGGHWHRHRRSVNRQPVHLDTLSGRHSGYSHQLAANHLDEMLLI